MTRAATFLCILATLIFVPSVSALSVEVVGQAPIDGALSRVRELAMDDAMRQASLRAGAQISSTQLMEHGVVEEYKEKTSYHLTRSQKKRNKKSAGRRRWIKKQNDKTNKKM